MTQTNTQPDHATPSTPGAQKASDTRWNAIWLAKTAADLDAATLTVEPLFEDWWTRILKGQIKDQGDNDGIYVVTLRSGTQIQDNGTAIKTTSNQDDAVAAMLLAAKERGWTDITVTGSAAFRRKVILQAAEMGINATAEGIDLDAMRDRLDRRRAIFFAQSFQKLMQTLDHGEGDTQAAHAKLVDLLHDLEGPNMAAVRKTLNEQHPTILRAARTKHDEIYADRAKIEIERLHGLLRGVTSKSIGKDTARDLASVIIDNLQDSRNTKILHLVQTLNPDLDVELHSLLGLSLTEDNHAQKQTAAEGAKNPEVDAPEMSQEPIGSIAPATQPAAVDGTARLQAAVSAQADASEKSQEPIGSIAPAAQPAAAPAQTPRRLFGNQLVNVKPEEDDSGDLIDMPHLDGIEDDDIGPDL
jgi:hypothetical protein